MGSLNVLFSCRHRSCISLYVGLDVYGYCLAVVEGHTKHAFTVIAWRSWKVIPNMRLLRGLVSLLIEIRTVRFVFFK
jgi:hypothetical protein